MCEHPGSSWNAVERITPHPISPNFRYKILRLTPKRWAASDFLPPARARPRRPGGIGRLCGLGTQLVPPVYPTPLYEALAAFAFFALLWDLRRSVGDARSGEVTRCGPCSARHFELFAHDATPKSPGAATKIREGRSRPSRPGFRPTLAAPAAPPGQRAQLRGGVTVLVRSEVTR